MIWHMCMMMWLCVWWCDICVWCRYSREEVMGLSIENYVYDDLTYVYDDVTMCMMMWHMCMMQVFAGGSHGTIYRKLCSQQFARAAQKCCPLRNRWRGGKYIFASKYFCQQIFLPLKNAVRCAIDGEEVGVWWCDVCVRDVPCVHDDVTYVPWIAQVEGVELSIIKHSMHDDVT